MQYRSIDRDDYQRAILRGIVRKYSENCVHNNELSVFTTKSRVRIFLYVTTVIFCRKSCFSKREITSREDFLQIAPERDYHLGVFRRNSIV